MRYLLTVLGLSLCVLAAACASGADLSREVSIQDIPKVDGWKGTDYIQDVPDKDAWKSVSDGPILDPSGRTASQATYQSTRGQGRDFDE